MGSLLGYWHVHLNKKLSEFATATATATTIASTSTSTSGSNGSSGSSGSGDSTSTSTSTSSRSPLPYPLPWIAPPAVHFQEHYFASMYGQHPRPAHWQHLDPLQPLGPGVHVPPTQTAFSLEHGVCFHRLLVLGRTNSHATFMGDEVVYDEEMKAVADDIHTPVPPPSPLSLAFKAHLHRRADSEVDFGENTVINGLPANFQNSSASTPPIPAPFPALRERRLKVVLALRPGPFRLITNLDQVIVTILSTGVVDEEWFRRHILRLEALSFKSQVTLLREADVFVTIHGAAITNGVFMRPGSVVIDIYNGRYLEFVFAPILRESGVKLQHVIVWKHTNDTITHCAPFPPKCLEGHVTDGNDLDCLGVRQCSVAIDVYSLHASVMEAYSHVLSVKWLGHH